MQQIVGADDAEIGHGVRQHVGLGAHPPGQIGGQDQLHQSGEGQTHGKDAQHGLPHDLTGLVVAAFTHAPGNHDRKAQAGGVHDAHQQKQGGLAHADGCRGIGADAAHHGGVHIVHCRLQQLLDDRGPGQQKDQLPGGDAFVQKIQRFCHGKHPFRGEMGRCLNCTKHFLGSQQKSLYPNGIQAL